MKRNRIKLTASAHGVLKPDDTFASSFQKLFRSHIRDLSRLRIGDGAVLPLAEDVHDARILLRRMDTLLRFLGDELAGPRALVMRRRLKNLSRMHAPARDEFVRNELINSEPIARRMKGMSGWPAFIEARRKQEIARREALRGKRLRNYWWRTLALAHEFLAGAAGKAARREKSADTVSRIIGHRGKSFFEKRLRPIVDDAKELHKMRKRMRRLRHLAESFAPILPGEQRRAVKKLHRIESCLGEIHDVDGATEHFRHEKGPLASALVRVLQRRRKKLTRHLTHPK